MKTLDKFLDLIHDEWDDIQKRFHVKRIGVFGSHVRGDETKDSDIDVLVEFDRKTFDNYMGLKFYLENKMNKKIDLVIVDAIKPRLREHILSEVRYAA